jgi:hypothetical protein
MDSRDAVLPRSLRHALRISSAHNRQCSASFNGISRSLQGPRQDLVGFLSELHSLRIDLYLHQQGLDTTTPGGKAMFQLMGVFAEYERAIIAERVRAGLARARDEGTRLAPGISGAHQESPERTWKAGRAGDCRAVWDQSRHCATDQSPFRRKRRRRYLRKP